MCAAQQYWADKSRPWRYVPVADLAAAFKAHPLGRANAAALAVPYDAASQTKDVRLCKTPETELAFYALTPVPWCWLGGGTAHPNDMRLVRPVCC